MTISTNLARIVHTADGTAVFFSLGAMQGVTNDNLTVTLTSPAGVETPQIAGVNYTLGGGGITFTTAPANQTKVTLRRIVPLLQPDTYLPNAPFPADVTENRLDQIVLALQQIADSLGLTVQQPASDTSALVLPAAAARANKALGFDSVGNAVALSGSLPAIPVSAAGQTFVALPDPPAMLAYLGAAPASAVGLPAGVIVPYAGATLPADWLFCAGQAVSRTTYAALFAAIGTTYGAGDGSTTFNLPDLRGRAAAGRDNMNGTAANRLTNSGVGNPGVNGTALGAAGGADRVALTTAQLAAHTHTGSTASAGAHTHTTSGIFVLAPGGASGGPAAADSPPYTTTTNPATNSAGAHTHTITMDNAGGGEAHPNVQPTLVLNYIIRT